MGRPQTPRVTSRHSVFDFAILGGFGTLVAHEIAYVPTSFSRAPVSHGHLPLFWAIISPLALALVGLYIVRSLRSRSGSYSVDVTRLGLVMAGIFVGMEIVERLLNGLSVASVASEGVMWAGLAAVPAVATILARLVSTAVEAVVAWISVPAQPTFAPLPVEPVYQVATNTNLEQLLGFSQSWRGPPLRIVH